MKILICGSSGFIGMHLVKALAGDGYKVFGLDLVRPTEETGMIDFNQGDIRVRSHIERSINGVDCVVNLAAKHHDFGISREEYFDTNEIGSKVLLDCLTETGVKKYIFFSTVGVYGNNSVENDERFIPAPSNAYGESKLAAEYVAVNWQQNDPKREVLIIRPTVVFGEGNTANVYNLIRQIDKGLYFNLGSGDTIKSACYVKNLIDATLFCMQRMKPGVSIFNYADKPDLTVKQIVAVISKTLDRRVPTISFPLWLGITAALPFDIVSKIVNKNLAVSSARVRKIATETKFPAQAIRDYGFTPKYTIEQGLQNMIRWYLKYNNRLRRQTEPQASD
jgi:nucleoside-diphosphate-sugar epimerase